LHKLAKYKILKRLKISSIKPTKNDEFSLRSPTAAVKPKASRKKKQHLSMLLNLKLHSPESLPILTHAHDNVQKNLL
jgi:hypothetical protein